MGRCDWDVLLELLRLSIPMDSPLAIALAISAAIATSIYNNHACLGGSHAVHDQVSDTEDGVGKFINYVEFIN